MKKEEINELIEYIDEYFEEGYDAIKAIDRAVDDNIRDLFKMDRWDEPKYYYLIIEYKDKFYKITIKEDGCCEATNDHRIMYWKHNVVEINN